jgi:MFS family permease
MHAGSGAAASGTDPSGLPWYRGLTGYHWFVLMVCWMGWFFDTMDQQLFILARGPAMTELLGAGVSAAEIKKFGGFATTILMLGWATGGIVFGILGDRWGRAKTMMLTILVYSVFTGLSALSVSWVDFSVYRFLTGMGVGGEFAAAVAMVAEVIPARSRPYALGFLQSLGALGNMTAAGISFLIPPGVPLFGTSGWRVMFLIGIVPALLVILVRRRLRELEGWVRAKEAEARGEVHHTGKGMGSTRELFGDRRWRRNVIVGILLGLAGIMGLWGIGFWLPELVRDVIPAATAAEKANQDWHVSLAMLLFNGGAAVGTYLFAVLMGRVGRRPAFALIFLAALCTVFVVFGFMTRASQVWWMAPLLGVGTLTIFGGYSIYFPELFPTRLRATGVGFCYNTARYVAATAPFTLGMLTSAFAAPAGSERAAKGMSEFTFLSSLGGGDNPIRYAAMIVACVFVVGLLVLPFAPETKGKPLPE